ncbi:hypothetical protein UFOVP153_54 [uncultured Caudovirales phage]|uniref:Uncharacterized protein n=1 Tax=uncultured Caudovirales phage TaxID=2100421 RepID=A0A6J7WFY3_9CAUD|nr:hypothetical protein UFOVP69_4 [uncultured Caudovirales phage]CAB5171024.1 hypothetical protein UFOVP153_54 [uncultured Caudovirales phage]
MTNEEIELKAAELSTKHGAKVHPLVFLIENSNERVIGYIQEPPRFVKLRVMDKGMTNPVSAASEIVDAYLIKEESDPRIWSEAPENDPYYIGATLEAYNIVTLAVNQFKKK